MEFKVQIAERIEKNVFKPDRYAVREKSEMRFPFPLVIGKTILQKGIEILHSIHADFARSSLRILVYTCNNTSRIEEHTPDVLLSADDHIIFDGTNYLLMQTRDPRYTYKYFISPEIEIRYEKLPPKTVHVIQQI
jgi:hypothetical protein